MSEPGRPSGGAEVVQVAAGLVSHDGRYLITKRRSGAHLAGLWEFPGGKREQGESLEECLQRELREELDIEIQGPVLFKVVPHQYPDRRVEVHFFRCRWLRGDPRTLGCEEYRWVLPGDLQQYDFPPADREVLAALQLER